MSPADLAADDTTTTSLAGSDCSSSSIVGSAQSSGDSSAASAASSSTSTTSSKIMSLRERRKLQNAKAAQFHQQLDSLKYKLEQEANRTVAYDPANSSRFFSMMGGTSQVFSVNNNNNNNNSPNTVLLTPETLATSSSSKTTSPQLQQLEALMTQLTQKDAQIETLQQSVQSQSHQIQNLVQQLQEAVNNTTTDDGDGTSEQLSALLAAAAAAQPQLTTPTSSGPDAAELRGQLSVSTHLTEFLQTSLSQAEDAKRLAEAETVRIQHAHTVLQGQLQQRDDQLAALQQQYDQLQIEIQGLQDKLMQVEQQAQNNNHDNDNNDNDDGNNHQEEHEEGYVEHLKFLQRTALEERDALAQKVVDLETEHAQAVQDWQQAQRNEREQAQQQVAGLEAALTTARDELQSQTEQVAALHEQLQAVRDEHAVQLEQHQRQWQQRVDDAAAAWQEKVHDLTDQVQHAQDALAVQHDEHQAATAALQAEHKAAVQTWQAQHDDATAQLQTAVAELTTARQQDQVDFQQQLQQAQSIEADLVQRIQGLEARLVETDQVTGLAKEALEKAIVDKQQADEELAQLRAALEEAQQQLHDDNSGDQRALEEAQLRVVTAEASAEQCQQAYRDAQAKVTALEEQLVQLNQEFQSQAAQHQEAMEVQQQQVDEWKSRVTTLEDSLADAAQNHETALDEVVQQKQQLEAASKAMEERALALQAALDEMEAVRPSPEQEQEQQTKVNELTTALEHVQVRLATVLEDRDDVHSSLEQVRGEKELVLEQLDEAQAQFDRFTADHAEEIKIHEERIDENNALKLEVDSLRVRVGELESALNDARRECTTSKAKVAELEQAKESMEQTLKRHVNELESKLGESTKEVNLLKVNLQQSMEVRSTHASRLEELTEQLSVFHARLREKDKAIAARDKQVTDQSAKIDELLAHIADVETQLAESDKVTKFSRTCSSRLEEEKRLSEVRAQKKISDLEHQLAESLHKLESLETSLTAVGDEKRELEAKKKDLEGKLTSLTTLVRVKDEEIEVRDRNNRDNVQRMEDLNRQIADVEGRLQVSNQVAEFLQNCLSRADEENRVNEAKWQKKIGELELMIAETRRSTNMAVSKAEEDKRVTEAKAKHLVSSVERSVQKFLTMHGAGLELGDLVSLGGDSDESKADGKHKSRSLVVPSSSQSGLRRHEWMVAGMVPLAMMWAIWAYSSSSSSLSSSMTPVAAPRKVPTKPPPRKPDAVVGSNNHKPTLELGSDMLTQLFAVHSAPAKAVPRQMENRLHKHVKGILSESLMQFPKLN